MEMKNVLQETHVPEASFLFWEKVYAYSGTMKGHISFPISQHVQDMHKE